MVTMVVSVDFIRVNEKTLAQDMVRGHSLESSVRGIKANTLTEMRDESCWQKCCLDCKKSLRVDGIDGIELLS